jgi:hypothetical protein
MSVRAATARGRNSSRSGWTSQKRAETTVKPAPRRTNAGPRAPVASARMTKSVSVVRKRRT